MMEYFDINRDEFDYKYVVMLSDVDQFQHMSFANYMKLMFLASDALFLKYSKTEKYIFDKVYLSAVQSQMHFKDQTSFGDGILIKVHSETINEKYFEVCYQFTLEEDGRDVADGKHLFQVLDIESGRNAAIPESLQNFLKVIQMPCRERFQEVKRLPEHPVFLFKGDSKYFAFDNLFVFFKHTNRYGVLHPYNYLEWTSYVREAFFQGTVGNFREVTARPIKMMTTKIASNVLSPSSFGDEIEARLTVGKIRKVSFEMIIRFWNRKSERVACETTHTIVFVDSVSSGFAEIPKEMMDVIIHYREPEGADA